MIIFQAAEFLATMIECVIGISFCASFMGEREIKLKRSIAAALILVMAVLVINQYRLFTLLTTVLGIVGIAVGASVIYKIKLWDSVIISGGYLLLIHMIDFFSISVLGLLLHDAAFGNSVTLSYSAIRLIHIVLTKILLLLVYFRFVKRIVTRVRLPVRKMWVGLVLCGAVVLYLGKLTFSEVNPQLFITWSLLPLLALLGIYSAIAYRCLLQEHSRAELAAEENKQIAGNYESLVQKFRSSQVHYHDMKNHNLVLEQYLRTGQYEKAEEYMERLTAAVRDAEPKQWTGIAVLDLLLECKRREAMSKKIYFNIDSEQVTLDLSDQELTALFGNALDNAIEACEQMKEGDGWIRISIRRRQMMVFVKIRNSCLGPPKREGERIISSKTDLKNHGWGLASMQAVVDRHNGTMKLHYENNRFTVMIVFFD